MAIEHLSDTMLQEYLDGNRDRLDNEIIDHLESCNICQTRLEQYRILYGELETDPIPELSPDFAQSVMTQIRGEAATARPKSVELPTPIFIVIGSLAALAAIIYFVNLKPLFQAMSGFSLVDYFDNRIVSKIYILSDSLNIDLSIVVMAALALIIAGGIDYILRHHKQRTASFFA